MRITVNPSFEWNGERYVLSSFEEQYEYDGPVMECKDKKVATDTNTKDAIARNNALADKSLAQQNQGISDYRKAVASVTSRDLYFNPKREGMVRQAVATNTDAAQKNVEGELSNYALRTGVNTANIPATIAEGQRESRRTGHDTLVRDQLDQEAKYEEAQKFGATALGEIPRMYGQNYGIASGASASAINAQAGVDQQRVQPQTPWWQAVLGAGAQVGAAIAGKPPAPKSA